MSPDEYQNLAHRTECDQSKSLERMRMTTYSPDGTSYTHKDPSKAIRLNHAVVGLAGEVGELASQIQKWIYYGKPFDQLNFAEEFGDCLWYIALGLNALGLSMDEVMKANIAKLKKRYPDKYSDFHAAEENRNRLLEAKAVIEQVSGMEVGNTPIPIGKDGRCKCDCGTPCPLGKAGMGTRCTQSKLEAAGFKTVNDCQTATEILKDQVCEVCKAPADLICHDSDRNFTRSEDHYFCKKHNRPTNILPDLKK